MIEILTYLSLISGGLLVFLLLVSIIGGLDWDIDFDADAGGGMGYVKGGLTFVSIGSWVVKMILATSVNPALAFLAGGIAGSVAVFLLYKFLQLLLAQESNVNWSARDALFEPARVYLRIPEKGTGIIQVVINGGSRELKARSQSGELLPTGTEVRVEAIEEDIAIVSKRSE